MRYFENDNLISEDGVQDTPAPDTTEIVENNTGAEVTTEVEGTTEIEGTTEVEDSKLELVCEPVRFVENLEYMGAGMLGIFIVIGLIVITTAILNKVTSPRKNKKKEQ